MKKAAYEPKKGDTVNVVEINNEEYARHLVGKDLPVVFVDEIYISFRYNPIPDIQEFRFARDGVKVRPAAPLNANQHRVMEYLKRKGEINVFRVAEIVSGTGSGLNKKYRRTAGSFMKRLKNRGLVLWHIKNKQDWSGVYWTLPA